MPDILIFNHPDTTTEWYKVASTLVPDRSPTGFSVRNISESVRPSIQSNNELRNWVRQPDPHFQPTRPRHFIHRASTMHYYKDILSNDVVFVLTDVFIILSTGKEIAFLLLDQYHFIIFQTTSSQNNN